jgi:predicted ATPase
VHVLEATAEAFTVSTPYIAWRELLRTAIGVGWEAPDDVVLARLQEQVAAVSPELAPWLPLLALVLDLDPPLTPEVEALAPEFRRARLHEVVIAFLRALLPDLAVMRIDDGQYLDEASADLLTALARELDGVPWLVLVARREGGTFDPQVPGVLRVEPGPLDPQATLALAEAATDAAPLNPHVLSLVAERSAGNPQFLRDLLRAAATGDADELPESIEAAAMARIDRLDPVDRTIVRRASVLGISFHPRLLADVLGDDVPPLTDATWERLEPYFGDDGDGFVRFRRSIVRDAAYAGLAYKTRRRLHAAVGLRLERDHAATLDEFTGLLSLHFFLAGDHERAWRYGRTAAGRAADRFAYAAASDLWTRALDAARRIDGAPLAEQVDAWEQLGEARAHAGDLSGAGEAFTRARKLVAGDPVREAGLIQRQAHVHERVGRTVAAVRSARAGLRLLDGAGAGAEADAVRAQLVTTLGAVRQRQGRHAEAARLCREAIDGAQASGDDLTLARA